ncbi:MAG: BamA/TamA family outer membrane protein [Candidatus Krumholzibacteriota bacterium]|nr:BamA/TamA family outer membrane protein [Candidatus Krumholzibacteriota bacterium]
MKRLIGIATTILCLAAAVAAAAGDRETKLSPEELSLLLDRSPQLVLYGGYTVEPGDTLRGPVVVVRGALDVRGGGIVDGDVWVVNGRLILAGASGVTGRAHLVDSEIYLSHDGRVDGGIARYRCSCRLDDELFESTGELLFVEYVDPRAVRTAFAFEPGAPSRVDYHLVSVGLKRENDLHRDPYVKGRAMLRLPLWKESHGLLGFEAGIEIPIGGGGTALHLEAFKTSETEDDRLLSRLENGVITSLTGDDFLDWYEKRGGRVGLTIRSGGRWIVESAFLLQEELSLEARGIPSLLFPRDTYRPNPAIADGTRMAFSTSITLDTRDGWEEETGWFCRLRAEKGFADGPGTFSYETLEIDARRYTDLPRGIRLDLRGRLFTAFDRLPSQLTQSLNGYAGVRGLRDLPFDPPRGDRVAFASAELRVPMPPAPLLRRLWSRWDLLFFSDAGLVALAGDPRSPLGFLDRSAESWGQTAGVGVSGESLLPCVVLAVAWDLDGSFDEPRVILRAQRSF